MSFLDFFLSPKARARKVRRERRHALRDAENAVGTVLDQQKRLETEAKRHLDAARAAKKAGDNAAAQRALVSARAAMTLAMKLEQKRWVFEQIRVKMEVAQSDADLTSAMSSLAKVTNIDPDRVADVFDATEEKLGEALDTDKFWGKLYDKEMAGASGSLEDYVPSLEDLDKQTDAEAAADLGASAPASVDLDASRDRLKRILEGK